MREKGLLLLFCQTHHRDLVHQFDFLQDLDSAPQLSLAAVDDVLGYAELLRDGVFGKLNDGQMKAALEILESTNHLTEMVNELLDEAQIRSNTAILQERDFSPAAMLEQASSGMEVLAQKKGLRFLTTLDPQLPAKLYGDERRLKQIIINLVGNAIKFTREGEVCLVFSLIDKDNWMIQVIDTGVGISKECGAYIFEPFRQADSAITRDNRGIGLGLSIKTTGRINGRQDRAGK